jgi:hypothetical protein
MNAQPRLVQCASGSGRSWKLTTSGLDNVAWAGGAGGRRVDAFDVERRAVA